MIKSGINIVRFAKNFISMRKMTEEDYAKKAASFLVDIARSEGGMLFKFMQYLDTDARFESFEHLSKENDFALPIEEVISLFEKEFDVKFKDQFKSINENPYLASLSQVHILTSHDDQQFALKIQYPQIKEKVLSQLKLLNLIPKKGMGPVKKWGVDIGMYQKMFQDILNEELDYKKEAEKMAKIKKLIPTSSPYRVASVVAKFSSNTMMTQEFIQGIHFNELLDLPTLDQERLLYLFLEGYFQLLIETGYYQGDSNFGNFLFNSEEDYIGLIDLGQMQFLSYQKREVLFSLLQRLINKEEVDYLSYYIALGFDREKIIQLEEFLPMLTQIIFEPFLYDENYDLNKWQYKYKLETLLGEQKWWFRSAGDEDFFLLMKSFTGIKAFIQKANIKLNWHRILKRQLEKEKFMFEPEKVEGLNKNFKAHAKEIKCVVVKDGEESVNLSFPIKAIFELESYMDKKLVQELNSQGIHFDELIQKALEDGGRAKLLFEHSSGNKVVKVSLK